ncbi:hypothetical protein FRY74_10425, partial [Vicingus serpentipes]
MRKIYHLLAFTFFILVNVFNSTTYAQGTYCVDADPFCTGTTYTFPNTYGSSEASTLDPGNNYGCLSDQPNPAWYYMEVSTAGNIDIFIEQFDNTGGGLDVDFILYGPYANLPEAISYCGDHGNASTAADPNQIVDCSFAPDPTETANITGAQVGDVYLMLITNYSDDQGTISFSQTGGSGATNCSIVFPPSCGTVDFHAEESVSPYNTISPFPSSMNCEDDFIYLVANDSATAGGYITPALHFEFTPTNDANDYVSIYSGGTGALGSGTLIYNGPLTNGTVLTVYGDHLSPTTDYYVEICDETSVDYYIYDGGTGVIFDNGTDASGNGCTRLGPYSPSGNATWATNAPGGSVGANDAGYAYFDPVISGPGTYDFTYYWNLGGCNDSLTKTITVTNPYSFTSLSYSTICKSTGGSVNPTLVGTAGGAYSSGTLGASLNTSTGVINVATAPVGIHTINYSVGTMPCGASGSGTINILPDMGVGAASSSPSLCFDATINPNITHTTTGSTGIGAATGLPAGVSANWSGGTITISGTPTTGGVFTYSIPLTGGCGTVNATGTITVLP